MASSLPTAVPVGQMRERVTLQQASVTLDANGDPAYAWSTAATLWARVEPTGGETETLAERRTAVATYAVTIRWRAGVSVAQRLLWRGRTLAIESVAVLDERRERVTLACRDDGPLAGITA